MYLDKWPDYCGGLLVSAAWEVLIVWIQPGILICNPTTEGYGPVWTNQRPGMMILANERPPCLYSLTLLHTETDKV